MKLSDKTIINILAQSSNTILLLISSIVLVRYLNKTEYGTYMQIMLISNTAIMLTLLGFPQSIYYYYPKVSFRHQFILKNILISIFIGIIAASIIYIVIPFLTVWLNNPAIIDYGWIISLLILFRAPSNFREPILISDGRLILNATSALICNLLFYIPIITAVIFLYSFKILLYVLLVSAGIEFFVNLILYYIIFSNEKRKLSKRSTNELQNKTKVSFKDQIKYALPIGMSSYLGIVNKQFDQYVVSVFFNPRDYAVYSRGAMKVPFLSNLPIIINNVIMEKYITYYQKGDIKTFLTYFHQCIEKLSKINFPGFAYLFAMSPTLITFLYTDEYIEASIYFRVYLLLSLIEITSYSVVFRASGNTRYILHATIIAIAINIALSILLVMKIGAIGAAIGTVMAVMISNLYLVIKSCKVLNIPFKEILPWRYLYRLIIASLLSSVPVYFIDNIFNSFKMPKVINLIINSIVYGYFIILFMMRQKLIKDDDMDILERWFRFNVKHWLKKIAFMT